MREGETIFFRARIWENFQRPPGTYPGLWSDIVTVTVPIQDPGEPKDPTEPTDPPAPTDPPPAPATYDWLTALAAARAGTPMRRQSWGNAKWLVFEPGEGEIPAVCVLVQRTTATINGVLQSSITRRPLSAGDFRRQDYEALDWIEAQ